MSKHQYIIRKEGDRHNYIKWGYYWQCFSHLYANANPEFRKRMETLKAEDDAMSLRKSLAVPGKHYPNSR